MTVHDSVAYILSKLGQMPAVKLHKLLYYSQAWSLVWDDRPLFTFGFRCLRGLIQQGYRSTPPWLRV